MTSVALYPDAELVAVTYLRAALAARSEAYATGVQVHNLVPAGVRVPKLVRVRRTGGAQLNPVADSPRLQVQVGYSTEQAATDEHDRQQLAQLVWALLRAAQGLEVTVPGWPGPVVLYRVATFGGPVNLPDPADNSRTVTQLTVEVGMRGRPV
jgi:hypothetical protein